MLLSLSLVLITLPLVLLLVGILTNYKPALILGALGLVVAGVYVMADKPVVDRVSSMFVNRTVIDANTTYQNISYAYADTPLDDNSAVALGGMLALFGIGGLLAVFTREAER